MLPEKRNGLQNTLIVATTLCLICSLVVSGSAVALKGLQDKNVQIDRKRNLLSVVGVEPDQIKSAADVEEMFDQKFKAIIIDMTTGKIAIGDSSDAVSKLTEDLKYASDAETLKKYDQLKESKRKIDETSIKLGKKDDIAGIKRRENFSHVYMALDESGNVDKYVFPVRGYGLWSMVQGYLAIENDLQTVAGVTFYDQKETPGLGGECVKPKFRDPWQGKKIYTDPSDPTKTRNVGLRVVKGMGTGDYQLDGMTGATITSNGISNMVQYWMGPEGFGPYIKNVKNGSTEPDKTDAPTAKSEGEKH